MMFMWARVAGIQQPIIINKIQQVYLRTQVDQMATGERINYVWAFIVRSFYLSGVVREVQYKGTWRPVDLPKEQAI